MIRPVFEANEIDHFGIWMELVPNRVKMIFTDPGRGLTPQTGQFIRLKQYIYKEDMTQLKAERITYLFGRKQLIPGLEICLAFCREGFKARCFIAP